MEFCLGTTVVSHFTPWFHIGGLSGMCAAAFSGTTIVAMYRFDVEAELELIERERVTTFGAVPSSLRQMIASSRHKVTVARQILKRYRPSDPPKEHVPTRRAAALEKSSESLDSLSHH